MSRENITLAILFADIANSTKLYATLGNKDARNLIAQCLSLLHEVTKHHGGTVIKNIGDEIMCIFPTADNAVAAAMDMNRDLINMQINGIPDTFPPNIYVGIQAGPVIREEGDVFGDAVNVAAYMVTLAKQRQIITTEDTVAAMNNEHKSAARLIDKTTIKSKSGEVNIYEIVWEQKDETVMLDASLDALTIETHMVLRFGDQTIEVGRNRPQITLGRQNHNDVVVNDIRVSRTHARIEYRRGKFLLIDQSTNGTYAAPKNGHIIKLRHDEAPLHETGKIRLGRDIGTDLQEDMPLIEYEITG